MCAIPEATISFLTVRRVVRKALFLLAFFFFFFRNDLEIHVLVRHDLELRNLPRRRGLRLFIAMTHELQVERARGVLASVEAPDVPGLKQKSSCQRIGNLRNSFQDAHHAVQVTVDEHGETSANQGMGLTIAEQPMPRWEFRNTVSS
jgi:hypothetical protein